MRQNRNGAIACKRMAHANTICGPPKLALLVTPDVSNLCSKFERRMVFLFSSWAQDRRGQTDGSKA